MTTVAVTAKQAVTTQDKTVQVKPLVIRKQIGSTVYEVSVYSKQDAKETMNDIILRLIKNEMATGRAAG